MTNFIKTSGKLVATGIVVTLMLAACSSTPKKLPPLVTGHFPSSTAPPCTAQQKPTTSTYETVTLESYPTSCGEGAAVIASYRKWLTVYNEVNTNPYGNGDTPRQELGHIYNEELHHTSTGVTLPPGCVLPTNITHAVSLPKACESLVSPTSASQAATGPMAYAANLLATVDTPAGVTQYLGIMNKSLSNGSYLTGGDSGTHDAVVRQLAAPGQPIELWAPLPGEPVSADPPPTPATLPAPGAIVWSCLTTATERLFSASGQRETGLPTALALVLFMEQVHGTWLVNSMGTAPVATPISKGAPCGTEY